MSEQGSLDRTEARSLPAHVPPELVKTFDFQVGLGDRPQEAIAELHEGSPIFFSPKRHVFGAGSGAWVITRAEHVREVMSRPEIFSSLIQGEFLAAMGETFTLAPLSADPPEHEFYRNLLTPLFSPGRMAKLEPKLRARCTELIEQFADRGRCDFIAEFAELFPTGVFIDLMGLPAERLKDFVDWNHTFIHGETLEDRVGAVRIIADYFRKLYRDPAEVSDDSIVRYFLEQEKDGQKLSEDDFVTISFITFSAGLDTTVAALGFTFRLLAERPELQELLRGDPRQVPRHIEEMMRLFSPVTPQRRALVDTELGDVRIKAGDILALSLAAASRDPTAFDHPATLDASRNPNPHLAFGFGIHRCVGAQLARRDLAIAVEEWLARVPTFRLDPEVTATASGGSVLSLANLHLIWN